MNYSQMLDFEINCAVAELVGKHADYCNLWADAGPIIQEHEISIIFKNDENRIHHAFCGPSPSAYFDDENPLRAAMVAFLKASEAVNA